MIPEHRGLSEASPRRVRTGSDSSERDLSGPAERSAVTGGFHSGSGTSARQSDQPLTPHLVGDPFTDPFNMPI